MRLPLKLFFLLPLVRHGHSVMRHSWPGAAVLRYVPVALHEPQWLAPLFGSTCRPKFVNVQAAGRETQSYPAITTFCECHALFARATPLLPPSSLHSNL